MATIDQIFSLVKYRANKSGYNSSISPADFNLLFPRAELKYFNQLYSEYARTQRVSESLSKFISDPVALTMATTGSTAGQYSFATLPITDLAHIDSITHTIAGIQYEVKRVEKDRLANNLSSVIEAPSAKFPIYTQYKTFLQFYPLTLANATMVYLKVPPTSIWGYTVSGILTLNTLVAGSSYTTGTYTAVALTGGTGTGATATIVVAGGIVTSVTIVSGGSNYVAGDTLSATSASIGGTGTGFSIKVATVATNRPVYNPTTSVQPLWYDYELDSIIYLLLEDIGINMRDSMLQDWTQKEVAKTNP